MSGSPYAVVIRQCRQIGNPAFAGGILGGPEIQPCVLLDGMRLVGSGNPVVRTMIIRSNRRGIPGGGSPLGAAKTTNEWSEKACKNTVLGSVVP